MSSRVGYVDIVKGIAIIAVVMGHISVQLPECDCLPSYRSLIYMWHVPLFFLVSGLFVDDRKVQRGFFSFCWRKVKQLYLFALFFYIPALLLHNWFIELGWYRTDVPIGNKIISEWSLMDMGLSIGKVLLCMVREPILGAMWFVYVLLFAFIGYAIITWVCGRMKIPDLWKFVVLCVLAFVSSILTRVYGVMIPRVSNVFPAMLLIDVGRILFRYGVKRVRLDDWRVAIVSLVVLLILCTIFSGCFMNTNDFPDILVLVISAVSAFYLFSFIGSKIEHTIVGRVLSYFGRNSFWIMALHFVGFKICSLILICLFHQPVPLYMLNPDVGNSFSLWLMYLIFGIFISLLPKLVFGKR